MKTKEEYLILFIEKGNKWPILDNKGIEKYDKELYDDIIKFKDKFYSLNMSKFSELLYCYLKDIIKNPICKQCNINKTKFKQFGFGYYENCSTKCSSNSKDKKEKIKNTCLEKYGHINVAHGEEISKRIKQTNIKKYGHEYAIKSEDVKDKIKQTNIKRYGCECTFQLEEVKSKIKETCLERYGVDNPSKNTEVKKKSLESNINGGFWFKWNDKELDSLKNYRASVRYHTYKNFSEYYYEINPKKLKISIKEYNIDHIFPIIEGWKNKIDPKDISHLKNLQLLWYSENRVKGSKTNMTIEDFYNMIEKNKPE